MRGTWSKLAEEEIHSNFHLLLLLRSEYDSSLKNWMAKSNEKYTSPEIQNEILQMLRMLIGDAKEFCKEIASSQIFYYNGR